MGGYRSGWSSYGLVVLAVVILSCVGQEGPDSVNIRQAQRLLALDTGKVWLRISQQIDGDEVEIDECELSNSYSFDFISDSDTLFLIGRLPDCTDLSFDTLSRYSWTVLGNVREQFQDTLQLTDIEGAVSNRIIRSITSNNLEWEFTLNEQEVVESFVWVQNPEF